MLDISLLQAQNAVTSEAVIAQLRGFPSFEALSSREAADTAARDRADDEKLQAGVDIAVAKGVLPAGLVPSPYTTISVEGMTTDAITAAIMSALPGGGKGAVIVLVGLSGTGKGTTVARLAQQLPNAVTWSNGNVFRSLTLLAVKWCAAQGLPGFSPDAALTPDNLASFMGMLHFGKSGAGFDIRVRGLGVDALVSDIANTELKGPEVSRHIPTVAAQTQGEVVNFVAKATQVMSEAGCNVIIEGREATVNHIPTPYRFSLTLADPTTIGRRRAAQRIMAAAAKQLAGAAAPHAPEDIDAALKNLAKTMAA
jgi:cytidylate kinase